MLIPLGFWAASGAGNPGAYELISSVLVGTATNNVGFGSIPQTYKHLQIRLTGRSSLSSQYDNLSFYLNNDTAASYSTHSLYNASPPASNAFTNNVRLYYPSQFAAGTYTANSFGVSVLDILDYTSTTKYKTTRALVGSVDSSNGLIALVSGNYRSTSAITQINFETSANIVAGSRFSLYGIRG
jgi:hypothetical protein